MCLILFNHLTVLLFLVAFYFHRKFMAPESRWGSSHLQGPHSTKVLKNGQVAIPK